MYCIKCGNELKNTSDFCPNCGKKIDDKKENQKLENDTFIKILKIVFIIISIAISWYIFKNDEFVYNGNNEKLKNAFYWVGPFAINEIIDQAKDYRRARRMFQYRLLIKITCVLMLVWGIYFFIKSVHNSKR